MTGRVSCGVCDCCGVGCFEVVDGCDGGLYVGLSGFGLAGGDEVDVGLCEEFE